MKTLAAILNEIGIPFAYDHFAEGESPEPPFVCYLLPQSDNFAADGISDGKDLNDLLREKLGREPGRGGALWQL